MAFGAGLETGTVVETPGTGRCTGRVKLGLKSNARPKTNRAGNTNPKRNFELINGCKLPSR
jgi:hypothetical protein